MRRHLATRTGSLCANPGTWPNGRTSLAEVTCGHCLRTLAALDRAQPLADTG